MEAMQMGQGCVAEGAIRPRTALQRVGDVGQRLLASLPLLRRPERVVGTFGALLALGRRER